MIKATLFAATILFTAISCKQTVKENKSTDSSIAPEQTEANAFTIDSIRVRDSLVVSPTLTLDFNKKILLLSGLNKTVLDSIYKEELPENTPFPADYSKSGWTNLLTKNKEQYFASMKMDSDVYMPTFKQVWDQHSDMKVHSDRNGFLTVKYSGYGYTGGAHGYAYENYKVADKENQKVIKLEDIVEVSQVDWNKVLRSKIPGGEGTIFEPEKLSYNQNFFFDNEKITFVYGQYEIAPYASGIIPINVPFSEISSALKPEFKQRISVK